MPKRTQLVPKKTQLVPKRKRLVPKPKDFLINEEILNTRGDQAFFMGAENAKIEVTKKVPKRVNTHCPTLVQKICKFFQLFLAS